MKELLELTALELGAAIKAGEVSVEEAVCTALEAMEEREGALNSFITRTGEQALERPADGGFAHPHRPADQNEILHAEGPLRFARSERTSSRSTVTLSSAVSGREAFSSPVYW